MKKRKYRKEHRTTMPFSISSMPEPLHNKRLCVYVEVRMVVEFKRSRNPLEHGIVLNGQIGYIIQIVGDGYCLIDFPQFIVKRKFKMETLEWYIHETDLYITKSEGVTIGAALTDFKQLAE